MKSVQRRATTAKSEYSLEDLIENKAQFLSDLVTVCSTSGRCATWINPYLGSDRSLIGTNNFMDHEWIRSKESGISWFKWERADHNPVIWKPSGWILTCSINLQYVQIVVTQSLNFHQNGTLLMHPSNGLIKTMIQHVENIIQLFVEQVRESADKDKAAIIIT